MKLASGDIIFREGDASDVAYVIESGRVEIFRETSSGEHQSLAMLKVGQMFGEMGPMDGAPRTASARAVGDVQLRIMEIDPEDEN